jgi:ABC-type nitrate/sulfonate/bicarbonate transport system substrate-binding protein
MIAAEPRHRVSRTCLALIALALLVTACTRPAEAPVSPSPVSQGSAPPSESGAPTPPSRPRETIVFAIPNRSLNYIQPIVASKLGFFEEAGVDVQVQAMQANLTVAALQRGDLQVSGSGGSAIRAAIQTGAPFTIISFMTMRPTWYLLTVPEVRTVSQLAGKRIGVTQIASSQHLAMEILARQRGVDPKQIAFLTMGTDPAQLLTGMHARVIDGIVTDPATVAVAEHQGFNLVESLGSVLHHPLGGTVATESYTREHPDAVRAFLKGFVRGLLYTKQKPRETAAIAQQELGLDADEATVLRGVMLLADAISAEAPGYADAAMLEAFYHYDVRLPMELPPDQQIPVLHDFRWLLEAYDELGIPRPR